MFCGQCGTEIKNGAKFCPACGARQKAEDEGKANKKRATSRFTTALVVIVVLAVAVMILGSRSYKKVVDGYVNATFDGEADKIIDLIPDQALDYALKANGYTSKSAFSQEAQSMLDQQIQNIQYLLGDDWKVSYEIRDVSDVKGSDLEDIKDFYSGIKVKVKEAKIADVKLTIEGGDYKQDTSMDIAMIKVGRSWYLDARSMGYMN